MGSPPNAGGDFRQITNFKMLTVVSMPQVDHTERPRLFASHLP